MTKQAEWSDERQALLRARARSLTDPLGAKGFRATSRRIDEERAARRATFVTVVGGFLGMFGLLAWSAEQAPATAQVEPPPTNTAASAAPLNTGRFERGKTTETAAKTTTVHKRTRSS